LERWTKQAESYLAAMQEAFCEKGIEVQRCVTQGAVVEAIIEVAESEGVDLIAMTSHGRTGLSRVFYGSVAAGVLHRVDRPLLLIRSQEGARTQDYDEEVDMYSTILVPLDGSKRAEAILRHVEDLAGRYGATVIFLRVVAPVHLRVGLEGDYMVLREEFERCMKQAENYLAVLQERFREKGVEAQVRVAHGSAVEAITETAKREGVDLIAMASHGRTGLSQVFYGSVAAGVLHRVDRPLLLIRSRNDE
jgi:nucleotide-binding universal stress UspA family protein